MDLPETTTAPRLLDLCPSCGYSLAGSPDEGVCPECGNAYNQHVAVIYGVRGSDDWRGWLVLSVIMMLGLALVSRDRLWPIWGGLALLSLWCGGWVSRNAYRPTMFTRTHRVVANQQGLLQEAVPGSATMNFLAGAMFLVSMILFAFAQTRPGAMIGYGIAVVVLNWRHVRSRWRTWHRKRKLGREMTLTERIEMEGTPAKDVRSIEVTRDKRGRVWLEIRSMRKANPLQPDVPIVYMQPAAQDERFEWIMKQIRHWCAVARNPETK